MEDSSYQADQLLSQGHPIENTGNPLADSFQDIKNETCTIEPAKVLSLYVDIDNVNVKKEPPDLGYEPSGCKTLLVEEPGCSKWKDQSAPGHSSTAIVPDCGRPGSKEIKTEAPDPDVKEHISSDEDSNSSRLLEDNNFVDDKTKYNIKSEPDYVEMTTEGQLKEEELILEDDKLFHYSENSRGSIHIGRAKIDNLSSTTCNFKTNSELHLQKHLGIHKEDNDVNWHRCAYCTYKSNRKCNLERHFKTHFPTPKEEQVYRFTCSYCPYKSKYKITLKDHLLTHKEEEANWFTCSSCAYKAKQKSYLKIHLLTHKNEDEIDWFRCSQCTFKSKRKYHLKIHLIIHKRDDEVNWFRCSDCPYKSKHKSHFKRHCLLSHKDQNEINWFRCSQCTYKTLHKNCLTRHLDTHKRDDEVNWFRCLDCSYKSKRKSDLNRHYLLHCHKDENKIN